MEKKFDPAKLARLNNPDRLKSTPPDYIWKKINLKNPAVLVDVGAGTGFFSTPFLSYMESGRVHALDISPVMVEWMEENIIDGKAGIYPALMEENTLPLDDVYADLVYLFNLYHELENPPALLKEACRVLRPGGKICILDWKKEEMPMGPPLEIRIDVDSIAEDLSAASFQKLQIDQSLVHHYLIIAEK